MAKKPRNKKQVTPRTKGTVEPRAKKTVSKSTGLSKNVYSDPNATPKDIKAASKAVKSQQKIKSSRRTAAVKQRKAAAVEHAKGVRTSHRDMSYNQTLKTVEKQRRAVVRKEVYSSFSYEDQNKIKMGGRSEERVYNRANRLIESYVQEDIENLTLGKVPKSAIGKLSKAEKKVLASKRIIDGQEVRVLAGHKGAIGLTRSQYATPDGVIHRSSEARIAKRREASKIRKERIETKKAEDIAREKAKLKLEMKRWEQERQGIFPKKRITPKQRKSRERSDIRFREKVDSIMKKKKVTFSEATRIAGGTEHRYRRGKYFAKHGTKGAPITSKVRKAIKRTRTPMRYPKVGHTTKRGAQRPMITKENMKHAFGGKQTVEINRGFTSQWGRKRSRFHIGATEQTMKIPRRDFGDAGRGVLFGLQLQTRIRIDSKMVTENLLNRYPAALRDAIIGASDLVGRKMLDIIEPYVPKDRGYLYQSAGTNVDQTSSSMVNYVGFEGDPTYQAYGVSISYNTPYANVVYFNEENAHGAAYNAKHGVVKKGEKETARWIEVALSKEGVALRSLLGIYAGAITAKLNQTSAGRNIVVTTT